MTQDAGVQETFLTKLLREVEQFDYTLFPPPNDNKNSAAVEVGICPEQFRAFFSLAQYYRREVKQIDLDHEFKTKHDEDCAADAVRKEIAEDKHKLLMTIFWAQVQEHFHLWGDADNTIGLRKGWVLIRTKRADNPLIDLLGRLG